MLEHIALTQLDHSFFLSLFSFLFLSSGKWIYISISSAPPPSPPPGSKRTNAKTSTQTKHAVDSHPIYSSFICIKMNKTKQNKIKQKVERERDDVWTQNNNKYKCVHWVAQSLSRLQLQLLLVDSNEYKYDFYLSSVRLRVCVRAPHRHRQMPLSAIFWFFVHHFIDRFYHIVVGHENGNLNVYACVILCTEHQLEHNLLQTKTLRTLDKFIELLNCIFCIAHIERHRWKDDVIAMGVNIDIVIIGVE